jgi:hypothetical protein
MGAWPSIHGEFQNNALSLLPTVTTVDARKSALSTELHGAVVPAEGLSEFAHSCQSHLSRNARLNLSKSRMPSPPSIFGLAAFGHRTRQWPPFAEAAPSRETIFWFYQSSSLFTFLKQKTLGSVPA